MQNLQLNRSPASLVLKLFILLNKAQIGVKNGKTKEMLIVHLRDLFSSLKANVL